jgi:hypothetical protein
MDKKHSKKIKRANKKKKEKKVVNEQHQRLAKQIHMFDRMPNKCSACNVEFPKTREAHLAWQVVVYNDKQLVRLFCPDCQEKAKKMVVNTNEV